MKDTRRDYIGIQPSPINQELNPLQISQLQMGTFLGSLGRRLREAYGILDGLSMVWYT